MNDSEKKKDFSSFSYLLVICLISIISSQSFAFYVGVIGLILSFIMDKAFKVEKPEYAVSFTCSLHALIVLISVVLTTAVEIMQYDALTILDIIVSVALITVVLVFVKKKSLSLLIPIASMETVLFIANILSLSVNSTYFSENGVLGSMIVHIIWRALTLFLCFDYYRKSKKKTNKENPDRIEEVKIGKYCSYCGKEIEANAVFCSSCGHEISKEHKLLDETPKEKQYYFQNQLEFLTYVRLNKGEDVVWAKGEKYIDKCKEGYSLYEQGNFKESIKAYQEALLLNPIGVLARFETCEAYLRLNDLMAAEKTMMDLYPMLFEDQSIAKFYRRLGYIKSEKGNYLCAAACYMYSKKFEDHPSVEKEMIYLASKTNMNMDIGNPEQVLKNHNIPVYGYDV